MAGSARFLAVVLVAAILCGCAKKKQKEEAPAPPPPPPPAAPPPPPQPKVYADPIELIPPEMTMAMGLRPKGLAASKFGESLLKQFEPAVQLAAPFGWSPADLEAIVLTSNPAADECLLCLRTIEPYNVAEMKRKLGLPIDSAAADRPEAFAWRDHPLHPNAAAFVDERTVLVGRRSAVERALSRPSGGPVRIGYEALGDKESPYWVAGDHAAAVAQASQISVKDFEKNIRDLVGLTGFASAVRYDGQLKLAMTFVFQSEIEAGRLSQSMEKLSSTAGRPSASEGGGKVAGGEIPEFGGAIVVGERYRKQTAGSALHCEFECASTTLSIGADFVRATGGEMLGDGLFAGVLGTLHQAVGRWRASDAAKGAYFPEGDDAYVKENVNTAYSWMVQLLPFLGYQEVYEKFDFHKGWHNHPRNFANGYYQIGEFLNPANPNRRWKGFPYWDVALTHFVGVSGVENDPSDVAAEYDADDPNAGVFGYNRVARDEQITDGLAETIMIIGNEKLPGPWLQGGGATIRGARPNPFDEFSGFHSEGLESPGVFVLMADGSARILSKDVDPKVFRALCTIHGSEKVDLNAIPTTKATRTPP